MRLLIFTQTVDRKDSSLGYYHDWLVEIAKHFNQVLVFALRIGEYDLPENVTVVSLRPWGYRATLRTALRVLSLAWRYRWQYDAVFVHMNQEYLLVAGWLWRLLRKPTYMWRNHYSGNFGTDIAAFFSDKVFYTSKSSYTAKYAQSVQMPVGVDVGSCHLDESIERIPHTVLFLGRFDESKHPDLLVEALGKLPKDIMFTATFVGGPTDPLSTFPAAVAVRAHDLGIADRVVFAGPVSNTDTYRYYRSHSIYVNCGKSGMLDKSLFKSIACGCLPIFASLDLEEMIGSEFFYAHNDTEALAERLACALKLSEEERAQRVRENQTKAIDAHTLPTLAQRLAEEMTI